MESPLASEPKAVFVLIFRFGHHSFKPHTLAYRAPARAVLRQYHRRTFINAPGETLTKF